MEYWNGLTLWVNMILYSNSPSFQHSIYFPLFCVSFNCGI